MPAELDGLPSAQSRPGLAAGALAMACLLDDKRLSTIHPSAQWQLSATLDKVARCAQGRAWPAGRGA